MSTLSGGEQKRLVLESLLRGTDGVLLLDEPDNYLDVPGKRWLEQQLATTAEDRAAGQPRPGIAGRVRQRIVTVEDRHVWVHGGGFPATPRPCDRISVWTGGAGDEEHEKLKELVRTYRQKALQLTWPPGCRPR